MAHFESDAEVYAELGGIFNNLMGNSGRLEQLRQADAVVQFAFRSPDATVTLDARVGKRPRVDLGATTLRADVVLAMDADTGRALLVGDLHPTVALARGDVRTKGAVSKVLRVVPATVAAQGVERDLPEEPEEGPTAVEADAAPEGVEPPAEGEPAKSEGKAAEGEPQAPAGEPEPTDAGEPEPTDAGEPEPTDAEAAPPVDPAPEDEAPAASQD